MITVTAPAKVNLHLEVLGLRSDGFHELAMVMQSIELADRLSFQNTADAQLSLTCDDASLSVGDDNLILRAAQLLRDRSGFSELGASIHLEKRIPIGAGLAGGSSDGAAALVGLNVCGAWATAPRIWSEWPLSSVQTCPSVWPEDVSSASGEANNWKLCHQRLNPWPCFWSKTPR